MAGSYNAQQPNQQQPEKNPVTDEMSRNEIENEAQPDIQRKNGGVMTQW